jgi:hypothetical protein
MVKISAASLMKLMVKILSSDSWMICRRARPDAVAGFHADSQSVASGGGPVRLPCIAVSRCYRAVVRYFDTAGPCVLDRHYMLPPEPRLPGARELIDEDLYFLVHAPRQTGKTTTLNALAQDLNADGRHVALRFSCERAEPAGDDYGAATVEILEAIAEAVSAHGLSPELMPPTPWPEASPGSRLKAGLTTWARTSPLPIVLFFDEIDALAGNSLISVLRQLRDGYTARPAPFPASVVLCGMRDIRDYKAASGGNPAALGGLFKTLDCESLAGFRSLCRRAFALIAANRTTASGDGTFPLSAWAQAGRMSGRMSFLRFEPVI